ncbi:MAG: tRNA (adenosine(37)-N6)-threonylcarbamoyltransferase complex transferase subunit TsaD [Verrucomicrobiota bacterium JB022]|nr:tRNA (adenosine(37)-N6)-threonylcarbamoyltransferase complex transferase subunit TsaD [Verrucomicrobiota bacterium JB022]
MIFAIESSCDESAVALFDPAKGIVGEWVQSSLQRHQEYGGIVPDVASRAHLEFFPWLVKVAKEELGDARPSQIAVTTGPGLAGCLALGVSLAQALGLAWQVPVVGVNHLRGHVYSPFIGTHAADPANFGPGQSSFRALLPHLGMIVSGGNTILCEIDEDERVHILAQTVDDAAGEALDKGAKLLGMPYPGGPLIERTAEGGDPAAYDFPRGFLNSGEPKFSFSGLKTSLRYTLEGMDDEKLERVLPNLCASYQQAVIDSLVGKTRQIWRRQRGRWKSMGLSGGVANNRSLRAAFGALAEEARLPLLIAEPRHTGDNASMIAFAAYLDPQGVQPAQAGLLTFDPSWELK